MSERVQSIERGIDILASLSEGPRNLTDVARLTGLSKPTAFRLLRALGYRNLVVKDPPRSIYMLGPGALQLLQGVMSGLGTFASVGRPALVRLWELTQETITLHVRVVHDRVCIDEIPSPHSLRYTVPVGSVAPIYVGSAGKVLLAAIAEDECDRVLRSLHPSPLTDRTIVDLDALRREIERTRRQGWATSSGERVIGASAISAPISGAGTVAALSILGPEVRLSRRVLQRLLPELQRTAREIEGVLQRTNSGDAQPPSSSRRSSRVRRAL